MPARLTVNHQSSPKEASLQEAPLRVGFILQQHFSLLAFTAAYDALVTANLVTQDDADFAAGRYLLSSYGLEQTQVLSDLGIEITTTDPFSDLQAGRLPDVLIVCGGFRCQLDEDKRLSRVLLLAEKQGVMLGGIWNGSLSLAHAGVLNAGSACALHPDNHALMREQYPHISLTDKSWQLADNRLTCAGGSSALDMMLQLVKRLQGADVTRAVQEILSCDRLAEQSQLKLAGQCAGYENFPEHLQTMIQLMLGNIEEPLSIDELAELTTLSRRQTERLFQQHLEVSPSRYYLQLRITHARRLLLQSRASVTDIAIASGFVSSSHFSNCFKGFYGLAPTDFREQELRAVV